MSKVLPFTPLSEEVRYKEAYLKVFKALSKVNNTEALAALETMDRTLKATESGYAVCHAKMRSYENPLNL